MALLTLKDIGKIYVSEGNVAVGIRGVNLSFERGEFVAITGKSGSGKSTLLNVISGIDSYEEGELFVEGQPTSHYLQPDWEEYRKKYISFIFQDYNIIDSFTVLQNVELALMHIEDKKERRRRALQLLDRVGLSSHIHQKGSKLSGGQKQRTVIARALAKDSPIILADEPTGNLDAATSKEIIALLREVSEDKLVIVVTHNFEQVESYATRHIRVYDGSIESDHVLQPAAAIPAETSSAQPVESCEPKKKKIREIKNGIALGRTIFASKPKLSAFLCFLMIIGTLGIFMITASSGEAANLFSKYYMFEPIEGRLVITKQTGEPITDEELQQLVQKYGASSYLHYDSLLDKNTTPSIRYYNPEHGTYEGGFFRCTYGKDYGKNILGRYPEADNEVLLYVPISYQPIFGKDTLKVDKIALENTLMRVTGVKYFYDNNKTAECLFTQNGFRQATAISYLHSRNPVGTAQVFSPKDEKVLCSVYGTQLYPSYEVEEGKVYINNAEFRDCIEKSNKEDIEAAVRFVFQYVSYDYTYSSQPKELTFTKEFGIEHLTPNPPPAGAMAPVYSMEEGSSVGEGARAGFVIDPRLLVEVVEEVLEKSYRQASLFFEDTKQAHDAAEKIWNDGYVAVPSDATYSPSGLTTIVTMIASLMNAVTWFVAILFLAFFINLCSSRTISAFKSDIAIMRSMGIQVKVIRIGMYVRMLLSLIPAFIMVILTAILIFTTPKFNAMFTYLYVWQYALIFLGMLLLTVRITYKQIRKLFGESVKKSLRGGATE